MPARRFPPLRRLSLLNATAKRNSGKAAAFSVMAAGPAAVGTQTTRPAVPVAPTNRGYSTRRRPAPRWAVTVNERVTARRFPPPWSVEKQLSQSLNYSHQPGDKQNAEHRSHEPILKNRKRITTASTTEKEQRGSNCQ